MIDSVNYWYSHIPVKGYTLTCPPTINYITDTKIRFELNEIIFINNDFFHTATGLDILDIFTYLDLNHPNYVKNFTHIFNMEQASEWGHFSQTLNQHPFVITFGSMNSPTVVWPDHISHITHEYMHLLGLGDIFYSATEIYEIAHYDFLDDVLGLCAEPNFCNPMPPQGYVCPLDGGFFNNFPGPYPI